MHRDCSSEAGRDRAPQVWCHRWLLSIITLRRALGFITLVSANAPWAPAEKAAGSDGDATVAPTLALRHGDACGHLSWRTGANYCENLHLKTSQMRVLWTMATFFRPRGNYFLKCKSHPRIQQTCASAHVWCLSPLLQAPAVVLHMKGTQSAQKGGENYPCKPHLKWFRYPECVVDGTRQ